MEKLIYSKFSNERSSQYAIETSIIKDDERKWVVKKPMYAEGKKHFENIKKAYDGLKEMFPDDELAIQPYIDQDEGMRFPYIEGNDMEWLLHNTYISKGYEAVFQMIKEYFDMIRQYSSTEIFVKTKEFIQMFGDVEFAKETKCGKFNNLDYGFANVIISEDKKTLIDYEWTVSFPVPIDFLLYRALHYYVYTCAESVDLVQNGIFKEIGFEDDEVKKYLKMEQNFQKFISSGKVSLGELHETMGQKTYNVHELYSEYRKNETPGMQVYYDYGDGFLHENSYFIKPDVDKNGVETICINNIPENALRVRIDPRKHACILKICELKDSQNRDLICNMDTNGKKMKNDIWIYDVSDPWLVVENDSYSKIMCRVSATAEEYTELVKTTIDNLQDELNIYKNKYNNSINDYNDIINSTSWKITEPFRKIRNRK